MAETWVINESPTANQPLDFDIIFVSNVRSFISISITTAPGGCNIYYKYGTGFSESITAYSATPSGIEWTDQAYRTIYFETAPTGDLLTWLQANAEKQEDPPTEVKNIKIGQATLSGLFIGEDEVDAVYVGSTKVWEKAEEPSGETWVINETVSTGTATNININFVSNNTNYTSIWIPDDSGAAILYNSTEASGYFSGKSPKATMIEAYRTVTFATAPTGDLLTWLQENAVKQ